MKRIFYFLLAFVISLCAVTGVFAQSENNKIYYTSSNGKIVTPNSQASGFISSIASNTYDTEKGEGCITFTSNLSTIESKAFLGCSNLTSITIPESVRWILNWAFQGCTNLTTVNIPESSLLTSLGTRAFYECTKLTTIKLPCASLGDFAFASCTNLKDVYFCFTNLANYTLEPFSLPRPNIHVYKGMKSKYTSSDKWRYYTIIDDIDYQTVTDIAFSQPYYAVEVGEEGTLSATVWPSDALLKDVKWTTESSLIELDETTGQFRGLADGKALVKATSVDYAGFSADVWVYVGNAEREEAISLSQNIMDLRLGYSSTLTTIQATSTGSDKPVTWTSSDTNVATVSNGVVNGVGVGTATITATIGDGVSASCTVDVYLKTTTLTDGAVSTYDNFVTDDFDQITYTRNFSNTKWQALYVPLAIRYEEWKDDFDVAYINSVRQYDNDGDGAVDETIMDVIYIKAGELYPNMPYLIKAKSTGEQSIINNDAMLYKAQNTSIECSTMLAKYTFKGTYETIPAATLLSKKYYAMGGGSLIMTNGTSKLKPFRWYMAITARNPMYNTAASNPQSIAIRVVGEENEYETKLYDVVREEEFDDELFNLNGQKNLNHEQLAPGFYIKNGKKLIIR